MASKIKVDELETVSVSGNIVLNNALSGSGASLTNLPVPTGFIGGLNTANGTDAAHDINIAVGSARDYTDTATMTLASAIT